ncbi:DUF998 domain-containing protein [Amycolatopsis thermalba]|uniref:DUF998 domain-containing protein n=1 Tax=Amycolatopsis thermalba TaxID=944492 RepID=A0ABY4NUY7_9PSEU|nr:MULTISPECIES: DUF998 domain-containing protein [Amycolatopsis]UQS23831.1 DUF998 domain-containing protein [Amycolatopsis thermalba]
MGTSPDFDRGAAITRSLLGYGVLAGPFYVVLGLVQALLRPGFDLTRHDLSLLVNGPWGWVQIGNLVLTGLMVIAAATGVGRALRGRPAGRWGARLIGGYGLGLIGAGVFVADPMHGFPAGTPDGPPAEATVHGLLHLVTAGLGFLSLVLAMVVLGTHFRRAGRTGWAWGSWVVGVAFLAGFGGLASGSSSPAVVLAFWVVLLLAWGWLAAVSVHLYRATPHPDGPRRAAVSQEA